MHTLKRSNLELVRTVAMRIVGREHGSGHERVWLVTTSAALLRAVQKEITRQLPTLSRRPFIEKALAANGWIMDSYLLRKRGVAAGDDEE